MFKKALTMNHWNEHQATFSSDYTNHLNDIKHYRLQSNLFYWRSQKCTNLLLAVKFDPLSA